jgi:hypothetical protein
MPGRDVKDGRHAADRVNPSTGLKESNATLYASAGLVVAGGAAAFAAFIMVRYKVSGPNEVLVRTGMFIEGIDIRKKAIQWPFQTCKILDLNPTNYKFTLHAMSKEKMEFNLPSVFTIGPNSVAEDGLLKYATNLLEQEHGAKDELIKGVIEGETRITAAALTIEEMFQDKAKFKSEVRTPDPTRGGSSGTLPTSSVALLHHAPLPSSPLPPRRRLLTLLRTPRCNQHHPRLTHLKCIQK